MGLGLYRLRRVFRAGISLIAVGAVEKGAVPPPLPYSLLPLPITYTVDFVDPGCAFCVFEQYACCCFEYQQLVARIDWLT